MMQKKDPALVFFDTISSGLRVVESIGDVIYADKNMTPETKRQVDTLIIKLNEIFIKSIKELES